MRWDSIYVYINNVCMCGLFGFFIGVIFFDFIIFELFYFIVLLLSVNYFLMKNISKMCKEKLDINEI